MSKYRKVKKTRHFTPNYVDRGQPMVWHPQYEKSRGMLFLTIFYTSWLLCSHQNTKINQEQELNVFITITLAKIFTMHAFYMSDVNL